MLAFISHPDCLRHKMDEFSPERPERIKVISEAIYAANLPYIQPIAAPLANKNELLRVHKEEYLDFLFNLTPGRELITLDFDTFVGTHTLRAALRAAGSVVLAVDLVMGKKANAAFCNVRPPGHHAEPDKAMGFCFFNNVAVGVAHAFSKHQLKRVAVIDFDVHHGNGTESIFNNNSSLLFCSSFQYPFYPNKAFSKENPHVLNLPLPIGTTGETYRTILQECWFEKITAFKPEMIFFSAGFDAHEADAMGGFKLHEEDYAWITHEIKKIADEQCKGRLVSVLEGGYELSVLGTSALAHIKNLI